MIMRNQFAFLLLLSMGLSACSSLLTVATPEEMETYPEARGIMEAWQEMTDLAKAGDCDAFQEYSRKNLMEEGDCKEAFEYMLDAPQIDWSKTQWDANKGKGKIYEKGKGDITSFIYSTSDDIWRFDSAFWSN